MKHEFKLKKVTFRTVLGESTDEVLVHADDEEHECWKPGEEERVHKKQARKFLEILNSEAIQNSKEETTLTLDELRWIARLMDDWK